MTLATGDIGRWRISGCQSRGPSKRHTSDNRPAASKSTFLWGFGSGSGSRRSDEEAGPWLLLVDEERIEIILFL